MLSKDKQQTETETETDIYTDIDTYTREAQLILVPE